MRALKSLFVVVFGLLLGAAVGYSVIAWALEQEGRKRVGAGGTVSPMSLVDQIQRRVKDAIDEGRRAAEEARAELEAEAREPLRPEQAESEAVI